MTVLSLMTDSFLLSYVMSKVKLVTDCNSASFHDNETLKLLTVATFDK